MKIVVLVKQVPNPEHIEFDQETRQLVREGVPLELNEFDVYAVTEGIHLRERHGGEVVVMTMGPPQAEEALLLTLKMGADRAIHLSDRTFAVADTIGTSRTLALAIEKEGADLVLCGRKTVDSETWQVPPEVAGFLGWPHLTNVDRIELADGRVRARRETDEGWDTYELGLPAVLSISEAANEGIWPPQRELESFAADGRIVVWQASDLVDDVQPDDKRFGQTGSPTRVLAVKDARPERAGAIAPSPQEAAKRALARLEEAAPRVFAPWDKPPHLAEKPGKSYDCWSVVELVEGSPRKVSLELLGKGRELAGKLGGSNCALLIGHDLEAAAQKARCYGAERIYVLDDPRLEEYHPDTFAAALKFVLVEHKPHVLLIPSTMAGRDYGPRVAGELELGMTGDCVDLGIAKAGRLLQNKPAYGGNIVSVIMGRTTPQLATVRPRMFATVDPRGDAEAEIVPLEMRDLPEPRTRLVQRTHGPETAGYELDAAEVVFCVGRGIGGAEAVPEVEALAARLGAATGGSRAVCDAGWLPKNHQIGLTGRAVAPRLYVTVAARGGFEQLVGSVKAGVIVALNEDEDAPVFAAADIGIVGDWRKTLPLFVDALADKV